MAEIEKPILTTGTRSELRDEAFQAAFENSGGILNDRAEAGALYALFDAQAGAVLSINSNLNSMVDASTINLLRALGVILSDGGRAVVTLTVILTGIFSTEISIPRFTVKRSGILFHTAGRLVIPGGVSQGQITAIALVYGTAGNVSAGPRVGDWEIVDPQPNVLRVISTAPATGGTTPERIEDVRNRPLPIWGDEILVRQRDFERASRTFLGDGSAVLAIPKMGADKRLGQPGNMHIFGLNADGQVLTATQIRELQTYITERCPLIDIHVDSMDVVNLTATARVVIPSPNDFIGVADRIWTALVTYLTPGLLTPGEAIYIKLLDRLVGSINGVLRVQSVEIGGTEDTQEANNYRLPFLWSVGRLTNLKVIGVTGENITNARIYTL